MIPQFELPSNPKIKIQLREATVADAIDFADVEESHEEELTTLFLNRLQDSGAVNDSSKWTGEDRRFALYWYWLNTTKDMEIALTYECRHCGKKHTYLQDFRVLADRYISINGSAERPMEILGKKWAVHPLSGEDMETLEKMQLAVDLAEAPSKKDQASMEIMKLALSVRPEENEVMTEVIRSMTLSEFETFSSTVYSLLEEMKHGLETEYIEGRLYLVMPETGCPEKEGMKTQLRYPFRNINYIPALQ